MSENKEEVKRTSKYKIVNDIMAAFKIGDSGKMDNFTNRNVNFFKPVSSRKESKETYLHCEILKSL